MEVEVEIDISPAAAEMLDALGSQLRPDRSELIREAVRRFVARYEVLLRPVDEAYSAANPELVAHIEELKREVERWK
jgi:predicted transcriptional regulator